MQKLYRDSKGRFVSRGAKVNELRSKLDKLRDMQEHCPKCGNPLILLGFQHVGFNTSMIYVCGSCHKKVSSGTSFKFIQDYALELRQFRNRYKIYECF